MSREDEGFHPDREALPGIGVRRASGEVVAFEDLRPGDVARFETAVGWVERRVASAPVRIPLGGGRWTWSVRVENPASLEREKGAEE